MTTPHHSLDALNAIDMPAPERYVFFVTEAVACGNVWGLKGPGGFVAFRDEEGHECFPFWPTPEFAEALADADWADCRAELLTLDVLMDRWLPGMDKDGRLVSVFPAPDGSAIVIDPLTLLRDLREERESAE